MSPEVVRVVPREDNTLLLSFGYGEQRVFDARSYLGRGIFSELSDMNYFKQVKPFFGGVGWPHEQDFSADTLYLESKAVPGEVVV